MSSSWISFSLLLITRELCADGCHIDTHLTNFFFDGARADLTKGLSMSPAFQVTHSFALGSQTAPSSYNLGAVFATDEVCGCYS